MAWNPSRYTRDWFSERHQGCLADVPPQQHASSPAHPRPKKRFAKTHKLGQRDRPAAVWRRSYLVRRGFKHCRSLSRNGDGAWWPRTRDRGYAEVCVEMALASDELAFLGNTYQERPGKAMAWRSYAGSSYFDFSRSCRTRCAYTQGRRGST